jgi:hypothetical protein
MKKSTLLSNRPEQVREVDDPWGLGVTVTIRRTNNPKAHTLVNREVTTLQGKLARECLKGIEAAREAGAEVPDFGDYMRLAEFNPAIVDVMDDIQRVSSRANEEAAIALVGGWKGEAFEEHELPQNGAFKPGDVRRHLFESLGETGGDEAVVPHFWPTDGGDISDDQRAKVIEIRDRYDELHASRRAEVYKKIDGSDLPVEKKAQHIIWLKSDEGRAEQARADAQWGEAINELAAGREAELSAIGMKSFIDGGETFRASMANWILREAAAVEKAYKGAVGFLAPSSQPSKSSKHSSRKRTQGRK